MKGNFYEPDNPYGHLTGAPYYIRERKGAYAIFDDLYAIRSAAESYNAGETVVLTRYAAPVNG